MFLTVKQAGGGDHTTIAAALAAIGTTPGAGADDIVEVYNGTYLEGILNTLPSGTSWAHPFTLRVAAGNAATIRNTGENNIRVYEPTSLAFFSIIDGFILDGQNLTSDQVSFSAADSAPSSICIQNCELINTDSENAIYVAAFAKDIQIKANHIHGGDFVTAANNAGRNHAIYFTGSESIIEDNHIHDIPGFGIHQYSQEHPLPSNNIVRRNIVHDFAKLSTVGSGILITSGTGTKCYQNLVYDGQGLSSDGGIGISVVGSGNQAYNNTVYDCSWIGIDAQGSRSAVIKNNIAYGNGQDTDFTGANGLGAPVALDQSNNLIGVDPLFTNPGGEDFTLQAGSPAIDIGTPIDGLAYTGAAPDAGAYERGLETLPVIDVVVTPNPIPPGDSGTVEWDTDGDTVDIPGVGEGLPPTGMASLPPGQSLVTVQAYNVNGSSTAQQAVGEFAAGLLYRATVGYMPRSIKAGADLSVDNLEIEGLMVDKVRALAQGLLIQGLSNEDLQVGRFDHAKAEIFFVNYENPESRLILPGSGNIGQMKMKRGTYVAELRGKTIYLQQTIGDLYSKICRAQIGDDITDYRVSGFGCGVRLDPPFWRSLTAYTVRPLYDAAEGSVVKPNVYNGRHFRCSVAGTSGFTEPNWNLTIGATTVDEFGGTAEWITEQALSVFGSVTQAWNKRFFKDAARNEPAVTGLGVNTGTAQYAIRALDQGAKWFEVDGDIASYFTTGTTFTINGSIGNDGTYTTTIASFTGDRTRITVSESIPDDDISGAITAPLTIPTGFFSYGKLTFLTGLNKGITKEVQDFRLAKYTIVDVDDGANLFMVEGDQTDFFSVGQQFPVTNSTGNDGSYDIVSVTYNMGDDVTEIEVAQDIEDATVDGDILSGPGDFELFERMPFDIVVGDEYVVSAGCDLSKEMCKRKFDNIRNRRAEDEIPGMDIANLSPDRPTA
jgi:parallel beta-helix repeat protein